MQSRGSIHLTMLNVASFLLLFALKGATLLTKADEDGSCATAIENLDAEWLAFDSKCACNPFPGVSSSRDPCDASKDRCTTECQALIDGISQNCMDGDDTGKYFDFSVPWMFAEYYQHYGHCDWPYEPTACDIAVLQIKPDADDTYGDGSVCNPEENVNVCSDDCNDAIQSLFSACEGKTYFDTSWYSEETFMKSKQITRDVLTFYLSSVCTDVYDQAAGVPLRNLCERTIAEFDDQWPASGCSCNGFEGVYSYVADVCDETVHACTAECQALIDGILDICTEGEEIRDYSSEFSAETLYFKFYQQYGLCNWPYEPTECDLAVLQFQTATNFLEDGNVCRYSENTNVCSDECINVIQSLISKCEGKTYLDATGSSSRVPFVGRSDFAFSLTPACIDAYDQEAGAPVRSPCMKAMAELKEQWPVSVCSCIPHDDIPIASYESQCDPTATPCTSDCQTMIDNVLDNCAEREVTDEYFSVFSAFNLYGQFHPNYGFCSWPYQPNECDLAVFRLDFLLREDNACSADENVDMCSEACTTTIQTLISTCEGNEYVVYGGVLEFVNGSNEKLAGNVFTLGPDYNFGGLVPFEGSESSTRSSFLSLLSSPCIDIYDKAVGLPIRGECQRAIGEYEQSLDYSGGTSVCSKDQNEDMCNDECTGIIEGLVSTCEGNEYAFRSEDTVSTFFGADPNVRSVFTFFLSSACEDVYDKAVGMLTNATDETSNSGSGSKPFMLSIAAVATSLAFSLIATDH